MFLGLPHRCRGNTALHLAVVDGHTAVVKKLVSAGAKVDAVNKYGCGWGNVCGFGNRGDGGALAQLICFAFDVCTLLTELTLKFHYVEHRPI